MNPAGRPKPFPWQVTALLHDIHTGQHRWTVLYQGDSELHALRCFAQNVNFGFASTLYSNGVACRRYIRAEVDEVPLP